MKGCIRPYPLDPSDCDSDPDEPRMAAEALYMSRVLLLFWPRHFSKRDFNLSETHSWLKEHFGNVLFYKSIIFEFPENLK